MVQIKMNKSRFESISLFVLILIMLVFLAGNTFARQSGSSNNAELVIWTSGTSNSENKTYSDNSFGGQKNVNHWNFYFSSNYTNSSAYPINLSNGVGNCTIRFNETGTYNDFSGMIFNVTSYLWQFNRSFSYKGNLSFQISCNSSYGNITLNDYFVVRNTAPRRLDDLISFSTTEESSNSYDFYRNVTDDDLNDVPLTYTIENITSNTFPSQFNTSFYSWININSTGSVIPNATNNNQNGTFTLSIKAADTGEIGGLSEYLSKILTLTINAINDAPVFVNLANQSLNISTATDPSRFEYLINITDEENNYPFILNISFLNCSVASWSTRNCSNLSDRQLFNTSMYSFNNMTGILNISFSPQRNDVGNYTINFTVSDSNNIIAPYNASTSRIVVFQVFAKNTPPTFTYACNNERNWTENDIVQCYINATDMEETSNFTYIANYSWFLFNLTATNITNGTVIQIANLTSGQNFSSFAIVNFTVSNSQVGNWSVNITIRDNGFSGDGARSTSQVINFSIRNINDAPILETINNFTLFNNLNYTIEINVTDNDLLIPDKRTYNESLTFTSNLSWISAVQYSTIGNISNARIQILLNSSILGNYTVLINATDRGNLSSFRIFKIEVLNNSAPVWNINSTNFSYTEGENIFINFSQNVTDFDRQNITFSFNISNIASTNFPLFSVNSSFGIINFTADDVNVGFHIVTLNASDNISYSYQTFNFTIYNLPDIPVLPAGNAFEQGGNITINSANYNMTAYSDNNITFYLNIEDNDFKINNSQKVDFGNESLTITTNISNGSRSFSLFTFRAMAGYPIGNQSKYLANFMPNRTNTGNYTVSINVSDNFNQSSFVTFNLTILITDHAPSVSAIGSQVYSILENFSLDINSTDLDEGNEPGAANFTYNITNLTRDCLGLRINSSDGIIKNASNATSISLSSCAGNWQYNVSVQDSTGILGSRTFNLYVYDYPQILYPAQSFIFNLKENISANIVFNVNHSVQDTVNYYLYSRGALKNQTTGYGNNSNFSVSFAPNFTEETSSCASSATLMLNVSNAKLSNSTSWNVTINHTNLPISLSADIGGAARTVSGTSYVEIILSDYFSDLDASDSCHRQNISFAYTLNNATDSTSGSGITIRVKNWTSGATPNITFSAAVDSTINCTVIAYEYNETDGAILNVLLSNNFTVHILESSVTESTPSYGGGGSGGGGTTPTPQSQDPLMFKLILPGPVSTNSKNKLIVPISLFNSGRISLKGIQLYSTIAKNGSVIKDIISYFDKQNFSSLDMGQKEDLNLTIEVNTEELGDYEITINASVKSPAYSDWGKIYLKVGNSTGISEKFLFVDELIVGNPECAELKELVDEAKKSLDNKEFDAAETKLNEVISACRKAISQKPNPKTNLFFQEVSLNYLSISAIIVLGLGIGYYLYKRRALKISPIYIDLTSLPKKV